MSDAVQSRSTATEQDYLEDNIATVAHHLGQPGACMSVSHSGPGLQVQPGEVLKEISRRLSAAQAEPITNAEVLAKRLREAAHYCTQLSSLEEHCRAVADELERAQPVPGGDKGEAVRWFVIDSMGFEFHFKDERVADLHIEQVGGTKVPLYAAPQPASNAGGDKNGARISNWLADYSQDLMEEGDFDQEAAKLLEASQWIADHIRDVAYAAGESIGVKDIPRAILDIANERFRQVEDEGWTADHDDRHEEGSLAQAALCYVYASVFDPGDFPLRYWPWDTNWWKPSNSRRNLVKAGALIAAEIERLDRASSVSSTSQNSAED